MALFTICFLYVCTALPAAAAQQCSDGLCEDDTDEVSMIRIHQEHNRGRQRRKDADKTQTAELELETKEEVGVLTNSTSNVGDDELKVMVFSFNFGEGDGMKFKDKKTSNHEIGGHISAAMLEVRIKAQAECKRKFGKDKKKLSLCGAKAVDVVMFASQEVKSRDYGPLKDWVARKQHTGELWKLVATEGISGRTKVTGGSVTTLIEVAVRVFQQDHQTKMPQASAKQAPGPRAVAGFTHNYHTLESTLEVSTRSSRFYKVGRQTKGFVTVQLQIGNFPLRLQSVHLDTKHFVKNLGEMGEYLQDKEKQYSEKLYPSRITIVAGDHNARLRRVREDTSNTSARADDSTRFVGTNANDCGDMAAVKEEFNTRGGKEAFFKKQRIDDGLKALAGRNIKGCKKFCGSKKLHGKPCGNACVSMSRKCNLRKNQGNACSQFETALPVPPKVKCTGGAEYYMPTYKLENHGKAGYTVPIEKPRESNSTKRQSIMEFQRETFMCWNGDNWWQASAGPPVSCKHLKKKKQSPDIGLGVLDYYQVAWREKQKAKGGKTMTINSVDAGEMRWWSSKHSDHALVSGLVTIKGSLSN